MNIGDIMKNSIYDEMGERRLLAELNKKLEVIIDILAPGPQDDIPNEFSESNSGTWVEVSGPMKNIKTSLKQSERNFGVGCGKDCACKR